MKKKINLVLNEYSIDFLPTRNFNITLLNSSGSSWWGQWLEPSIIFNVKLSQYSELFTTVSRLHTESSLPTLKVQNKWLELSSLTQYNELRYKEGFFKPNFYNFL